MTERTMSLFHRLLLIAVLGLASAAIQAQYLKAQRDNDSKNYQLIDEHGKALSNFIFSDVQAIPHYDCQLVTFQGWRFLVGPDGTLLVPQAMAATRYSLLKDLISVKRTGSDLEDVYDYQGHLVFEGIYSIKEEISFSGPKGKEVTIYSVRETKDGVRKMYLSDLHPFPSFDIERADVEHRVLLEAGGRNVYNMMGKLLFSAGMGRSFVSLPDAVPYDKAGKNIQAIYSREEYNKLYFITTQPEYKKLFIYSPTGRKLGEVKHNYKLSYAKTMAKGYKKYITSYLKQRQTNEQEINRLLEEPMYAIMTHNYPKGGVGKAVERVPLYEALRKNTGLELFPVLQPNELTAAPDKQTDRKLRASKYGKIKDYERKVSADGLIYYIQSYTNGQKGVADAKGKILIPPTKNSIIYHTTSQEFKVYTSVTKDGSTIYPAQQIYNFDGHLIADCAKKGFGPETSYRVNEDGRSYLMAEKDGHYACFDYFGVQLTPWVDHKLYCSSIDHSFFGGEGNEHIDYYLPATSRRGGKPSPAKKFAAPPKPQKPVPQKPAAQSGKNQALAQNNTKKPSSSSNTSSSTPASSSSYTPAAPAKPTDRELKAARKAKHDEYWQQYQRASGSQAKLQALMQCLGYCDEKSDLGAVLNDIGVIYSNQGQTDVSMAYFRQAAECGNYTAQNNIAAIEKEQRRQNRIERAKIIGNTLLQMGQTIASYQAGNAGYASGGYSNGYNTGSSSQGGFFAGLLQGLTTMNQGGGASSLGGGMSLGSGSGRGKPQAKYPNGTVLSDGGVYSFYDMGTGTYECISYEDGSATCTTTMSCYSCVSTGGKCSICHGTGNGYAMLMAADRYIQCPSCGGGGVCGTCHGTRWCPPYSKHLLPGEAEAWMETHREQKAEERASRSSSTGSSKSSSSSSSFSSCPKCHGAKWEPRYLEYATGTIVGWLPPMHNSLGTTCPVCSRSTDHYHTPCSECHGYGHIRK